MEKFDIVVIGAGVVGLAIAQALSGGKKEILVLEKEKTFGQGTSSRNSEVIHAGMYYPHESLKARLCVRGRRLLYELCEKHKIPCKKTGKLIIATEKRELAELEKISTQGDTNGVEGLSMLTSAELNKIEPNLSGTAALFSRETGIIDSHALMEYFLTSREKGVIVVYNSEVTAIKVTNRGYSLQVRNAAEKVEIVTAVLINSSGLDADAVAGMAGIDLKKNNYELHYCKGEYFRVAPSKARLVSRLVYPVPNPASGGLGVHATLDLAGGLRLGPDDCYLKNRVKDYSVDAYKKEEFYSSARRFMPFIKKEDLSPDTAGIRPKLQEKGGAFRDFLIREESDKGFPGFINLLGIESPGLTASPAIAEYVKGLIR